MTSFIEPTTLAKNHAFRSRYIQSLIQGEEHSKATDRSRNTLIPKRIIQYWHNPQNLPPDVANCLDSWSPLASAGFTRLLFDDQSASTFISTHFGYRHLKAFDRCHHPAMRCDYFRLCYILLYGGFYVDADELYSGKEFCHYFCDTKLKLQPLCYDATADAMVTPQCFLGERTSSDSWIFYVNNNPLMSPPNHPVIRMALDRASELLLTNSGKADIQSTTGPGNMSASLVEHALTCERANEPRDFQLLSDWDEISTSVWPLSYRNDKRNWRLVTLCE